MTDSAVDECNLTGTVCAVLEKRPHRVRRQRGRAYRLRRDLRSSLGDAAGSGMMVGTGETYLPAFVLAAGLGEVIAGLVASVPQLAGGITQLICPRGVRLLGSHRNWVVTCATIQGLSFVPLVIAASQGMVSAAVVLAVATLYWSAGLASGPPWNTWMGTIVPCRVRSRYFAGRTRIQQAAVLAGFLLSGVAIQFGATSANALAGFALLFALAVGSRLASVACLAHTHEPQPMPKNIRHIPLPMLLRRFRRGAESQRLLYLSLVQGAAYFAGPYFAPYMFRVLKLSYAEYVILISTAYLAKVVSLSIWGKVAVRFGIRKLLWIGGIGIVPVAGAWIFSDSFWFLIFVQLLSGAAWAAYELAVFLICFNSIRAEERTSILTLLNLSTTAAMVVGSLGGAAVLILFGATRPVYYVLFGVSSLLRLGTLFFLRRVPARLVESQAGGRSRFRFPPSSFLSLRPLFLKLPQTTNPPDEWIDSTDEPLRRPA
jgi:MFS family permease